MRKKIKKAYAISDAKIQFVSLVDSPANLKPFIIAKGKDNGASFSTYGKIVKADSESHFVTGIVYEPLAEDAHDNYMTEAEIEKAAHWFMKNGNNVDLQHSFEALPSESVAVVESWVAKSDCDIDGEPILKGTWLMTMEITDDEIWKSVEDGEITGFSMGGMGQYSKEDDDLSEISKSKGLIAKLAKAVGLEVVEKGEFAEKFAERQKGNNFWAAFDVLEGLLRHWEYCGDKQVYEEDPEKIQTALQEFSQCITDILATDDIIASITKAAEEAPQAVEKAGKKISSKNKETLCGIADSLNALLKEFDDTAEEDDPEAQIKKKEDIDVDIKELSKMVDAAVAKQLEPITKSLEDLAKAEAQPTVEEPVAKAEETEVTEPVAKAEEITADVVADMVAKATESAVAPLTDAIVKMAQARGVAHNLNSVEETVQKSSQHYMQGMY